MVAYFCKTFCIPGIFEVKELMLTKISCYLTFVLWRHVFHTYKIRTVSAGVWVCKFTKSSPSDSNEEPGLGAIILRTSHIPNIF